MSHVINRLALAWAVLATLCCAGSSLAADQTLLGSQLVLRDPSGGADASRRRAIVAGRERASANTLVGDPTSAGSGATIVLYLNGSTSVSFADVLPQGTSPAGAVYWTGSSSTGFKYADPKGSQGAVRKLRIRRSKGGTFSVAVQMSGKDGNGTLPTPPNPGTSGCVALTLGLDSTAERYSLQFGAESALSNVPGHLFAARNPTAEGVCPPVPCGVFGYPTCSGICGAGEVCRPLSGTPGTFDPTGFCACVAAGGATDCPPGSAYQVGGDQNNVPIGCSPIPTCNDVQLTGYPTCAGGVPAGAVCQAVRVLDFVFGFDASVCVPFLATESCDSFCSLAAGGGACPSGEVCAVSSGGFEGMDCGCFAPPFCVGAATCGGNCPDGACIACPPEICGPSPVCLCSSD